MDAVCADNTAVPWSAAGQGGAPPTPLEVKCNAARRDSRRVCKVPRFCGLRFAQPHCRYPIALCGSRSLHAYFTTTPPPPGLKILLYSSTICASPSREVCATERPPHATWSYARSYTCPPEICAPYLDTKTHMTKSTRPPRPRFRKMHNAPPPRYTGTPAPPPTNKQTNVPHTKVQVDTTRFGLLSMHALCPTPHQDCGGQKSGRPSMLYAGRPRCRRRANESDQGEPQRTPRCALRAALDPAAPVALAAATHAA
jgi:hypothetical protein